MKDRLCSLLIACQNRIRTTYEMKGFAEQELINWMTESGERVVNHRGWEIRRVTPRTKATLEGSPSQRRMQRYEKAHQGTHGPAGDYLKITKEVA